MPGRPFQSKLLPHLEFIRECRAQRMSYPRIAAELRSRFGLHCAPSTVFSFVKVRARRGPVFTLPESGRTTAVSTSPIPTQPAPRAGVRSNWLSYDPAQPLEKDPP
mgnify:CR=1 FL=1|tara:strand:- start:101 stop:418 length:318 start_codon:yes stop_codon:yes gene_type:complete